MTIATWRFAVDVRREDHSPVRQVEIVPDWEPLCECLRFRALRQGASAARAFALDCRVDPIWHRRRGEPYVEGVRVSPTETAAAELCIDADIDCFASPARAVIAQLVKEGTLADGDPVRCLPMAFAQSADAVAPRASTRFKLQARPPELLLKDGSTSALRARSTAIPHGTDDSTDEMPVFLPRSVIDETIELTQRVHGTFEIGGLLVGHLCRDVSGAGLHVEVTAQIPARHVQASSARLTFTSDTWTAFRAALELRRRGEIMLGWWHSHPVREWCKDCPEAKQRSCALRGDYFSAEDRLLHRAMFPRAYSVALVINDVAYGVPTQSLFGWHNGAIGTRGYHVLEPESTEAAPHGVTGGSTACAVMK